MDTHNYNSPFTHSLQHHGKNHHVKAVIHRNTKNILSILFDEVNFSEDKFDKLKEDLNAKHLFSQQNHKESQNDIFSRFA